MIDVVIVANSEKGILRTMTNMAIRTARENAGVKIGQIVIVEQCLWSNPYPKTKMLRYDFEFNYNKCLNLGFSVCKSQYIAFCNNDLYFEKDWAKNAIKVMRQYKYLSVSPTPKHLFAGVKEGYEIGTHVLGWCLIIDRVVMDKIGQFDTPVNFWYSDNVYALQLQSAGIKHALVGNSKVKHFTSSSLTKVVRGRERIEMQKGQEKIFNQYKKDVHPGIEIETKKGKGDRSKYRV
jgi:hypothetical protein